jgi:hypothetical protein
MPEERLFGMGLNRDVIHQFACDTLNNAANNIPTHRVNQELLMYEKLKINFSNDVLPKHIKILLILTGFFC